MKTIAVSAHAKNSDREVTVEIPIGEDLTEMIQLLGADVTFSRLRKTYIEDVQAIIRRSILRNEPIELIEARIQLYKPVTYTKVY